MTCTGCAKTSVITIQMRIGGREVVFHRCAKCERNHWETSEGAITLDTVLELARAGR